MHSSESYVKGLERNRECEGGGEGSERSEGEGNTHGFKWVKREREERMGFA